MADANHKARRGPDLTGQRFGMRAVLGRKVTETGAEKAARVSKETGVSVRALSLFSKIAEDKSYTADAAHKDFGHIKRKKVA